jgi:hypothetical protein
MDGAVREPGYVFILPAGKLGPMRTVRTAHERINNASGLYERTESDQPPADIPLYDVIEEIPEIVKPASDVPSGPVNQFPLMSAPTEAPPRSGSGRDVPDGSF